MKIKRGIGPNSLMERLIAEALSHNCLSVTPKMRVDKAIKEGTPIPDWCKPGAMIQKLDTNDKIAIQGLKSEDTRNIRMDAVIIP